MAIQLTRELQSGVILTDAYHMIRMIKFNKEDGHAVYLDVFVDYAASLDKAMAETYNIAVPYQEVMTGNNVLQQCYTAIMAMPGYKLATEV